MLKRSAGLHLVSVLRNFVISLFYILPRKVEPQLVFNLVPHYKLLF